MISKWAKRLEDLKTIIINAEKNYFDANLFRLNINNAILMSRTVTFIMQKEKKSKDGLDQWYVDNVQAPLKSDKIMGWLVDSRNIIEKEGDLDVNSSWNAYHLYTYWHKGDALESSSRENLFIDMNSLVKVIREKIPVAIIAESAIAIERRWVANSLPEIELIDAVSYGYETLRKLVIAMDAFAGFETPPQLVGDESVFSMSQRYRKFIKFSDGGSYSFSSQTRPIKIDAEQRAAFAKISNEIGAPMFDHGDADQPLDESVRALAQYAAKLFARDKYHISLCVLLSKGKPIKLMRFDPEDRADKFIFWHELAYCVKLWGIDEVRYIAEAWQREMKGSHIPVSDWPIVGETLIVSGARQSGECFEVSHKILRSDDDATLDEQIQEHSELPNFYVPLMKAWGRPDEWIADRLAATAGAKE
jgi:hypothetical protein